MSDVQKENDILLYVISNLNSITSLISQFLNTRERCGGKSSVLPGFECILHIE